MKSADYLRAEILAAQAKLGPPPITEVLLVPNEFVERGKPIMSCHPDDFQTLKKLFPKKERDPLPWFNKDMT